MDKLKNYKFTEYDRKKVINAIEKRFSIKLKPVGDFRKLLHDEVGRLYCIIGAYKTLHNISIDIIKYVEQQIENSNLIIAVRSKYGIQMYIGCLKKLIENKHNLSTTQSGAYLFNTEVTGQCLRVIEINGLLLESIMNISYSEDDRQADKLLDMIKARNGKLNDEYREYLYRISKR